jgi:hypothetical protein
MTGSTQVLLYKNGSLFYGGLYPNKTAAELNANSVSALLYLNGSTDYVEIYAYQNSGTSATISGNGSAYCWFNGSMVRGA